MAFIRSYWFTAHPGIYFRGLSFLQFVFYVPALVLLWMTDNLRKRNFLILGLALLGLVEWWRMFYFVPQNELIKIGEPQQIENELQVTPLTICLKIPKSKKIFRNIGNFEKLPLSLFHEPAIESGRIE